MPEIFLEISRGLAALWVFLYHLHPRESQTLYAHFASVGDLGVSAFFVISGFCIYGSAKRILERGQPSMAFLKRRLLRIYPPFWASVVVVLAVPVIQAALYMTATHRWEYGPQDWYSFRIWDWPLFLSLGRIFFTHGQPLHIGFVQINAVYWSLAIEVQFYLVMFVALCFRKYFYWILGGVTVAGMVAFPIRAMATTGLFLSYWPMFALGIGVYVACERRWTPWSYTALAISAALLGGATLLYFLHPWNLPGTTYNTMFALGYAVLVFSAAPVEGVLRRFRSGLVVRAFVLLGTISYSVYLIHAIVHRIPAMLIGHIFRFNSAPYVVSVVGLTLGISYAFYVAFERPFVSASQRKTTPVPTPAPEPVPATADVAAGD